MSSKPSPDGATEVIRIVRDLRSITATGDDLARAVQKLDAAVKKKAALHSLLKEKLRDMDCHGTKNYGWEGRLGWLLGEMIRQVDEGVDLGVKD